MRKKPGIDFDPLSRVKVKDLKSCLRGLKDMFTPKMRWKVVISVVLGCIAIACSLSYVWISKRLVDVATGLIDEPLWRGVTIFAVILLVQLVTRIGSSYWNSYMTMKCANEMRMDMFSHVIRSQWSGKDSFHSGDTVNRLEEDIRVVTDVLCGKVPDLLVTLIQLVASSAYLLILAPKLLWVLLILAIVAVIGSRMFFGPSSSQRSNRLSIGDGDADSFGFSSLADLASSTGFCSSMTALCCSASFGSLFSSMTSASSTAIPLYSE